MTKRPSPQLPFITRLKLVIYSFFTSIAIRKNRTVNRHFLSLIDPTAKSNPNPKSGVCTSDLNIDPSRNLWIRIFTPKKEEKKGQKLPLIIYFHGGGFVFFTPASRSYDSWCRRICSELQAIVISVNYRLAPEHKCPAPYDDGMDVLKFLDSGQIDSESVEILSGLDLDLDLENCYLAGDTAGANIAHHMARRWAVSIENWEKIKIKGIMAIQPFFGGEERTEAEIRNQYMPVLTIPRIDWYWKAFLPQGADRNHEAAHVFGENSPKLEELFPPILVVVGGFDILKDWQLKYYDWLKRQGKNVKLVEYPEAIHAFYAFPNIEDSGKLIEVMTEFIGKQKSD
ncbi:hypothetical protein LUZ60_004541 [Juncus effusus]|nr:hypothetical protein LUZ60_004541 [Juncus effusus]